MRGVVECVDRLAQRVNLGRPARLVTLLTVLGQARTLHRSGELAVQIGIGARRDRLVGQGTAVDPVA